MTKRESFRNIVENKFLPFLVTDGGGGHISFDELFSRFSLQISNAVKERIPLIQIREKSLEAAELELLARKAIELTIESETKVFINERFDIALSCGLSGVHLPSCAIPTAEVRKSVGDNLVIGRSVHDQREFDEAKIGGADYVFLSPIFTPNSKSTAIEPLGIEYLEKMCAKWELPVFALGGITNENIPAIRKAGASGYAGISVFNRLAEKG